jgi:hypothetical protein
MTVRQFALHFLREVRDHRNFVLLGMWLSAFLLLLANFLIKSDALGHVSLVLGIAPMALAVIFDFLFDPAPIGRKNRKETIR